MQDLEQSTDFREPMDVQGTDNGDNGDNGDVITVITVITAVSYTHLTLPTNLLV